MVPIGWHEGKLNFGVGNGRILLVFFHQRVLFLIPFASQRSGVRDRDTVMSAKVNMEAQPKEPDRTPVDPLSSSTGEAVLICGSDGVAKKARPQPHTTTAFLLPGEPRSEGDDAAIKTMLLLVA